MLDWLIIGGGIHGTHLSLVLTEQAGVPRDNVRVLDPYPSALSCWDRNTNHVGMQFLRSPQVHHIDLDPMALKRWAETDEGRPYADFRGRYKRPSTALFQRFTHKVIEDNNLDDLRIQGMARGIERDNGGFVIGTGDETLRTKRVVIAIGLSEQPLWPAWARRLRDEGALIQHIFDPAFDRANLPPTGRVVVIGGGITAVQASLALADERPGDVILVARYPLRLREFDSDPCWLGPKCMDRFLKEDRLDVRRRMIRAGRSPGTVPQDDYDALAARLETGGVVHIVAEVVAAEIQDGRIVLERTLGVDDIEADAVVLCTGFSGQRPGSPWLDKTINRLNLPCAPCDYPAVNRHLEWSEGLHVMGPLAELELGPTARNIAGARKGAQRIASRAV